MIVRYQLDLIAVPVAYTERVELLDRLVDENMQVLDRWITFAHRPWSELRLYLRTTLEEEDLSTAEMDMLSGREHHFGVRRLKLPDAILHHGWSPE